jgi:hypothetical protein
LRQLLDGDQTQGERRPRLARDPDRLIDQSTLRSFAQHSEQIDRFALGAEPTGIPPTCPHHNIGASTDNLTDAIGLQISAVPDTNFSSHDRYAVEPFTSLFVRQFERSEAFARQIESAAAVHRKPLAPRQ